MGKGQHTTRPLVQFLGGKNKAISAGVSALGGKKKPKQKRRGDLASYNHGDRGCKKVHYYQKKKKNTNGLC